MGCMLAFLMLIEFAIPQSQPAVERSPSETTLRQSETSGGSTSSNTTATTSGQSGGGRQTVDQPWFPVLLVLLALLVPVVGEALRRWSEERREQKERKRRTLIEIQEAMADVTANIFEETDRQVRRTRLDTLIFAERVDDKELRDLLYEFTAAANEYIEWNKEKDKATEEVASGTLASAFRKANKRLGEILRTL
jgi:Na+-transporting methylmalonyl-CoA/oxaloacetate decarboxylase gamma subunit